MAAGMGAASGGSLESTLNRKFLSVTNTMDSIQGLSTWCIDNKKYHSLIVRQWMKCLKKSDGAHRLNLLYLANDIIQNCKRKNAIVYRTAFADVLPEAFSLVNTDGDVKVIRSVERILSIWDERGVYTRTLVADLRSALVKEESPPETPVEQKTPVESKADLRSKIVAEFVPQALIDQLSKFKRSLEEVDLREKQLTAMRVDICSSEALKKLKDKAGGKKFSKDFEEGSAQLQEFVKYFDKQNKIGPPLLEALGNADVFYEMQYKEVKIVANAYQTFANRVSHLKRKLDALKATLPDLDDSPIPSPSADAPSPTGSESPFHGMDLASPIADPDPDLDGSAMDDDAEPPAPSPLSSLGGSPVQEDVLGGNDNREVEDMELSEEEGDPLSFIDTPSKLSPCPEASAPLSTQSEPSAAQQQPVVQVAPPAAAPAAAVASVDVGKIGSILNSLNSAMKTPAPPVETPPDAASAILSVKIPPAAPTPTLDASSLVNLLSKVDMSPSDLLSALSKVQSHSSFSGISSLLGSSAADSSPDSPSSGDNSPPFSFTPTPAEPVAPADPAQNQPGPFAAPVPSSSASTLRQSANSPEHSLTPNPASALVQAIHKDMELAKEPEEPSLSSSSLESKIHNFLQGNPAFSAFDFGSSRSSAVGADHLSPATAADAQDGTPVRDEGGGTPTQDEVMDKPVGIPFDSAGETATIPAAYPNETRVNPNDSHQQSQNGQIYQPYMYGQQEMSEQRTSAPAAHYQPVPGQSSGSLAGERALGNASNTQTVEGFQGPSERSWYGDTYPEGVPQRPNIYTVPPPGGPTENKTLGRFPFQPEQTLGPCESQQSIPTVPTFFRNSLPPVPRLPPPPPPPQCFDAPPSSNSMAMRPLEQKALLGAGPSNGPRGNNVMSGMVVHDHQHKSAFHTEEKEAERVAPPRPDDPPYQEEPDYFQEERRLRSAPFFQDNPYRHTDESHYTAASPQQHFPRVRGHLSPPPSNSDEPFYAHGFQRPGPPLPRPPPTHFAPRRPPPPRHEIHHPGMRPPQRPPLQAHPPHPRGPPRQPFPRFPGSEPRFRGKRPPGPRGGAPMFPPKRPFLPPRY